MIKLNRTTKILLMGSLLMGSYVLYAITDMGTGEHEFRKKFARIKIGTTRNIVERNLGNPNDVANKFYLSQYIGFEKEYNKAKYSGSVYYLIWKSGIDTTYVIGFDSSDKVIFKSYGGT